MLDRIKRKYSGIFSCPLQKPLPPFATLVCFFGYIVLGLLDVFLFAGAMDQNRSNIWFLIPATMLAAFLIWFGMIAFGPIQPNDKITTLPEKNS